jgi:hypothetical protein
MPPPDASARPTDSVADLVALVSAACANASVRQKMHRLLCLPAPERGALLHVWLSDLIISGAPRPLVRAVACLQNPQVADQAGSLVAKSRQQVRRIRRAGAVLLVMFGSGLGLAVGAAAGSAFSAGLASPASTGALVGYAALGVLALGALAGGYWLWRAPG